jgi:hypothetical protein
VSLMLCGSPLELDLTSRAGSFARNEIPVLPTQWSTMSSARPKQKTITGIRKCVSVRIRFVEAAMSFLPDQNLVLRDALLDYLSELISMTNRYLTSCFNMRS